MTTYICGGSNSVRRGGWVHHFDVASDNISIGASTSIMGAYRVMFCRDVAPGDTVIWEYALNDANQALGRGRAYTVDYLLAYCEAIIRHCAERGARFIAIVLTPRPHERLDKRDPYRRKLIPLLRHYKIPFVEVSQEMRRKMAVEKLPDDVFFDDFHYKEDHRIVKHTARRAKRFCDAPFVPVDPTIEPLLITPGRRLDLLTGFRDAAPRSFSNRLLTIDVFPPESLPLHIPDMEAGGRIVGIFMITTSNGGVLELKITAPDGKVSCYDLSVAHNEPGFSKPVFKMFSLINALSDPVVFSRGESITLSMSTGAGLALNDTGFAESPDTLPTTIETSIAGILVELES